MGVIMTDIDSLLSEREKTHGGFAEHAATTQELKKVVHKFSNKFTAGQQESLDMICHKIGRICAGDPNTKDHWDDIAGYAQLISKSLK